MIQTAFEKQVLLWISPGWHEAPCFPSQIRRWTMEALCTGISRTRAASLVFPFTNWFLQTRDKPKCNTGAKSLIQPKQFAAWRSAVWTHLHYAWLWVGECFKVYLLIHKCAQFHYLICCLPWCDAEIALAVCCRAPSELQVYSFGVCEFFSARYVFSISINFWKQHLLWRIPCQALILKQRRGLKDLHYGLLLPLISHNALLWEWGNLQNDKHWQLRSFLDMCLCARRFIWTDKYL